MINLPAMRINRRLALLLLSGWALTLSAAGPAHAADPVCLYQSRTYSEGAFICVQRSLMQSCTSDGSRLVWRIVADKDIGDRCVSPIPSAQPRKRMVHRTRIARQVVAPAQPDSAKCFVFNGKRYCE
ncbi:DUF1496 domain-containing protein [Bradyrhizobium sp.]|uniref:DUF1496 domain-containing protein n=1 Tax=Bradyrhizobium sp. TaxID=376 RepID=UPI001DC76DEA|nr:DUF1496 domain-containing protein [Bradyrhizobium sp.]MBI5320489.1 DUF1496 domain-containing protein [Bradyrhizobium sp.]